MKYDFLIVGAGITGCVLAERLASVGKKILLLDKRPHMGGNCYDHEEDAILVQDYGPHIFHTSFKNVFSYLSRFTRWNGYRHKVVACYRGEYYPIPINLTTVNLFFGKDFRTWAQAEKFIETKRVKIKTIRNSRDVVLSRFGKELYEAFVKNYSKKQWDHFPEEMVPGVLERLPLRKSDEPFYYNDAWQGMPDKGFAAMMKKMIRSRHIRLELGTDYRSMRRAAQAPKTIYTGRIDEFFDFRLGRLDYRCMKFNFEKLLMEQSQPNAVVNYPEHHVPYLRSTEFKLFYPERKAQGRTVLCKETASHRGEPAYPVMTPKNIKLAAQYLKLAKKLPHVFFAGRLGTYQYLDIDRAVKRALDLFMKLIRKS